MRSSAPTPKQAVRAAAPASRIRLQHVHRTSQQEVLSRRAVRSRAAASETLAEEHRQAKTSLKALREWSVVNGAIRDGLQMVLLRKGGIEEKGFKVEAKEFLLFPSYFHADASLLKPGMADRYQQDMALDPKAVPELHLTTFVKLTGAWATPDPGVVAAVEDLHIGTPGFLENRTKWRKGQALTVLELQAWRLATPVVVQPRPELFGCFSWVDLDDAAAGFSLEGAVPCIPEAEFRQRQQLLRQRLAALTGTRELPL